MNQFLKELSELFNKYNPNIEVHNDDLMLVLENGNVRIGYFNMKEYCGSLELMIQDQDELDYALRSLEIISKIGE